jgi:3-hydroxyacyl-[acyl-carrier-protein] dehydratase
MPPDPFLDISKLDFDNPVVDKNGIYNLLPHRHEFEMLDGIVYYNVEDKLLAGYRDVGEDEFWVRGHIPGKPIYPGILMIETAAHLVSYASMRIFGDLGFLGFSAVDQVKFRGTVGPGQRLVMVGRMDEAKKRRCKGSTQGFVDGKMVFEGIIVGMWL